ncbi:hypothetical protein NQZ68_018727 [Dissostichus eleginoides]|nr:hypothetical protein NQZ68_018727 [Dissostichus eleginoides]
MLSSMQSGADRHRPSSTENRRELRLWQEDGQEGKYLFFPLTRFLRSSASTPPSPLGSQVAGLGTDGPPSLSMLACWREGDTSQTRYSGRMDGQGYSVPKATICTSMADVFATPSSGSPRAFRGHAVSIRVNTETH